MGRISKASAIQRKGRAGRVSEVNCYRLYSNDEYDEMNDFTEPQITRSPLENVCLIAKALMNHETIADFCAKLLDPPNASSVQKSVDLLKEIGALDDEENLTT